MTKNVVEIERQERLEKDMRDQGISRFRDNVTKAREKKRESSTTAGRMLMKRVLHPEEHQLSEGEVQFTHRVAEFVEDALSGKPSAKATAVKYLQQIPAPISAFLATKALLDCITLKQKITKTALTIATYIEDEVRYSSLKKNATGLYMHLMKQVEGKDYKHTHTVMNYTVNKLGADDWKSWPQTDKLHLGMKLIDLFIETTGLVELVHTSTGKNQKAVYIQATKETLDWVKKKYESDEVLSPVYLPTIIPPKQWTTPFDGGYHSQFVKPLKLVKTRNQNYLEELSHCDIQETLDAVNAMQSTAWKVNSKVFEVMEYVWNNMSDTGVLPNREPLEMPPKPHDIETNKEARYAYRRQASKIHEINRSRTSKQLQVAKTISIARKFVDEEAIYFPYTLDFRGRAYAVPLFLNPQGPDYAKGLLTFSKGIPLGETGAAWLAIHGANCFGNDKLPLDDRMEWVVENSDRICQVAEYPLVDMWWTEADEPFQFLAFCFEWKGFVEHGEAYESSLPVALDGSNNGLQHFSAMLRDPVGGKAVNLLPSEKPEDIYQEVAEAVIKRAQKDYVEQTEDAGIAWQWLNSGLITRKVTKRPTMTLVYGASKYGMKAQVHGVLKEWIEEGKDLPFEDDGWQASDYMGRVIWDALADVVSKAREAMDFLQECAKLAAKEGLPVNWETPVGFPVQQAYYNPKTQRVKTAIAGGYMFLSVNSESNKLSSRKQASSVSPNWVHSLDAAHLQRTVNKCKENGIDDFALVHDSFGTHAANAELLGVCLRSAFQEIHQVDLLEVFRNNIYKHLSDENREALPMPPAKGTLELALIDEAEYFFA